MKVALLLSDSVHVVILEFDIGNNNSLNFDLQFSVLNMLIRYINKYYNYNNLRNIGLDKMLLVSVLAGFEDTN